jgi:hypothetical protein
MPVSMVTLECPCCGREIEVIAVGSAHYEDEVEPPKKRRGRKSKTSEAFDRMQEQIEASLESKGGDGDGPVRSG